MLDTNSSRQLRAFRAAAFGFLLALALPLHSQSIYITEQRVEAEVKVFVTKYRTDADLIVHKTLYEFDAKGNKGRWNFVEYKFKSDKIVYFVKYKSDADIKIHFTPYKTNAKWINSEKKHLFY